MENDDIEEKISRAKARRKQAIALNFIFYAGALLTTYLLNSTQFSTSGSFGATPLKMLTWFLGALFWVLVLAGGVLFQHYHHLVRKYTKQLEESTLGVEQKVGRFGGDKLGKISFDFAIVGVIGLAGVSLLFAMAEIGLKNWPAVFFFFCLSEAGGVGALTLGSHSYFYGSEKRFSRIAMILGSVIFIASMGLVLLAIQAMA